MVWKFLSGFTKKNNLQATVDRYRFRNLPFAYNWDNLVRSYDLRMYYIQNSHNNTKKYQYTQELERIHNELNYLSIKGFVVSFFNFINFLDLLKRQVIFLLLVTTFLLMVEKGNDDW